MSHKDSLKIGVLLGGVSNERPVSLRSGQAIYEALVREGYHTVMIDIRENPRALIRAHKIDIAFIALHGRGGEDGMIQRVLDTLKIPYTGSDAWSSRHSFDKVKTKRILVKEGIPTPRYAVITKDNWKKTIKKFTFPVVIKPLDDGSSIGVFIVPTVRALEQKLGTIFKKKKTYLLEEKIEGREITVGILGKRPLPIVELRPRSGFYDYHSKYTAGETEYLVPASFPEKLYKRYQALALKTHRALGARDLSRIDMMIDEHGHPYVLELNSIPGFTATSLLPKAAKHSGLEFGTLCRTIVTYAQRRRGNGAKKK